MNPLKFALILLSSLLATRLSASERLVYALTHGDAGADTEIFSIAPGDAQPTRIYSDASSAVVLGFMRQSGTSAPIETAVAGSRLFAPGKERGSPTGPRATGIFEFSLDGTGKCRKILDLPAGERVDLLIVSGDSTRLAYLSLTGTSLTFFIHDVKTGGLLHKLDMLKIAQGGIVRNAGWLPENKTIFFTLEPGAGDTGDDYKPVGTWLIQEDGAALRHLPATLGVLQEPGYRSQPDLPPVMLGVVNGRYLFDLTMNKVSKTRPFYTPAMFLVLSDPPSGRSTKIVLEQAPGLSQFVHSRSGLYIAYVQQDPSKFVGNSHIVPPEHVWIQPLPIGDPREILSLETGVERHANLTLIGWMGE